MKKSILVVAALVLACSLLFQNCGQPGSISQRIEKNLEICEGISCDLTPLTDRAAITTILLALGDAANQQLVVNGASAQLIAETVIRYTSPQKNPRILVVRDRKFNGEDPEDTLYVVEELLKRYQVEYIEEPSAGLTLQILEGFDVIWFNNPGHPMSSQNSRDALLAFPGAVVLQGDDLTRGSGFDMSALTGLRHIDNGAAVVCNDVSYPHDNNNGEKFRVSLSATQFPLADNDLIRFRYGNDIDNSVVVNPKVEILATAMGGPEVCTETRPAIVRYLK